MSIASGYIFENHWKYIATFLLKNPQIGRVKFNARWSWYFSFQKLPETNVDWLFQEVGLVPGWINKGTQRLSNSVPGMLEQMTECHLSKARKSHALEFHPGHWRSCPASRSNQLFPQLHRRCMCVSSSSYASCFQLSANLNDSGVLTLIKPFHHLTAAYFAI